MGGFSHQKLVTAHQAFKNRFERGDQRFESILSPETFPLSNSKTFYTTGLNTPRRAPNLVLGMRSRPGRIAKPPLNMNARI